MPANRVPNSRATPRSLDEERGGSREFDKEEEVAGEGNSTVWAACSVTSPAIWLLAELLEEGGEENDCDNNTMALVACAVASILAWYFSRIDNESSWDVDDTARRRPFVQHTAKSAMAKWGGWPTRRPSTAPFTQKRLVSNLTTNMGRADGWEWEGVGKHGVCGAMHCGGCGVRS